MRAARGSGSRADEHTRAARCVRVRRGVVLWWQTVVWGGDCLEKGFTTMLLCRYRSGLLVVSVVLPFSDSRTSFIRAFIHFHTLSPAPGGVRVGHGSHVGRMVCEGGSGGKGKEGEGGQGKELKDTPN